MKVELSVVTVDHKAALANLVQLYCYDLSEFRGFELTPHGTFVYPYLDHYFVEDGREACFVTADGHLAGFTMTRRLDDALRQVGEFFVVRRHRRRGIARAAAHQMFRRHPGEWELAFDHANDAAVHFWPEVVAAIADGPINSSSRYPPDVAFPGIRLRFRCGGP